MTFTIIIHRKSYILLLFLLTSILASSVYIGTSQFRYKHFRHREMVRTNEFHSHYYHKNTSSWAEHLESESILDNLNTFSCPYESSFFPTDGSPCYAHMTWTQWAAVKIVPRYIILFFGVIINIIFPGGSRLTPANNAQAQKGLRRFAVFRLLMYGLLCLYRLFILYWLPYYLIPHSFKTFDFSDHVVLSCTDFVIIGTEIFYRLSIAGYFPLDPIYNATFTPRLCEYISKSKPLLFFLLHSTLTIMLGFYSSLHTSRAFHYPSESWFGLLVGVKGAIIPAFFFFFYIFNKFGQKIAGFTSSSVDNNNIASDFKEKNMNLHKHPVLFRHRIRFISIADDGSFISSTTASDNYVAQTSSSSLAAAEKGITPSSSSLASGLPGKRNEEIVFTKKTI